AEDRAVINDLIAAHARIADLSDDRKIVPVRARTIVAIPEPLRDGYAFIEHIDGRELIAGVGVGQPSTDIEAAALLVVVEEGALIERVGIAIEKIAIGFIGELVSDVGAVRHVEGEVGRSPDARIVGAPTRVVVRTLADDLRTRRLRPRVVGGALDRIGIGGAVAWGARGDAHRSVRAHVVGRHAFLLDDLVEDVYAGD